MFLERTETFECWMDEAAEEHVQVDLENGSQVQIRGKA